MGDIVDVHWGSDNNNYGRHTIKVVKETLLPETKTSYIEEPVIVYHGTSKENIKSIIANGFDLSLLGTGTGNKGLYGAGAYVSPSIETAIYYSLSKQCIEDKFYQKFEDVQLLKLKLYPGRIRTCGLKDICIGSPVTPGYDTHFSNSKHSIEYCVFDVARLIPVSILHFDEIAANKWPR